MRKVRALCNRIMAGPPPAADLAEFCERLGARRGRPIVLLPFVADEGTVSGMWVRARSHDFVFHDNATSRVHQDAIIWHELAHLLLDHPGPVLDPAQARLLLPDLDPAVVVRMLGRDAYDLAVEREAEELASLLMLDHADLLRRPVDRAESPLLERLKQALNFREGPD